MRSAAYDPETLIPTPGDLVRLTPGVPLLRDRGRPETRIRWSCWGAHRPDELALVIAFKGGHVFLLCSIDNLLVWCHADNCEPVVAVSVAEDDAPSP